MQNGLEWGKSFVTVVDARGLRLEDVLVMYVTCVFGCCVLNL